MVLAVTAGHRVELVAELQPLRVAEVVEVEPVACPGLAVPVEGVDPVHAACPVIGGAGADHLVVEQQPLGLSAVVEGADVEVAGVAGPVGLLDAGVDPHRLLTGQLDPLRHVGTEVGAEEARRDDQIDQPFLNPGRDVEPDSLRAGDRAGHPDREADVLAPRLPDAVQFTPAPADQVGHERGVGLLVADLEVAGNPHEVVVKAGHVVALTRLHHDLDP